MTAYQNQVVADIHAELAERRKQRIAEYGEKFVDVILVSPDKHGRGKVGFSCEFAGCFAQFFFNTGWLRNIGNNRWAVLKP